MDKTTRALGAVGIAALLIAASVLLVALGGAPARAATVDGLRVPAFIACPPGAPPMSSLCSPAGWALAIEEGTATVSQAAAAGVAGYAPTASAAATTSLGPAALATGTALTVGISDFGGGTAKVDTTVTDLYVSDGLRPGGAGWVNDIFTSLTYGGAIEFGAFFNEWNGLVTVRMSVDVQSTRPWFGNSSASQVGDRVAEFFGVSGQTTVLLDIQCIKSDGSVFGTSKPNVNAGWFSASAGGVYDKVETYMCPAGTVDARVKFPIVPVGVATPVEWSYSAYEVVPEPEPGMQGAMVTEYTCKDGAGVESTGSVAVAVSSALPDVPVEIPPVSCPAGSVLVRLTVTWVTDAGEQVLYDYQAPEWVYDIPVEYPGCSGGECTIQLWRIFSAGAPAEWCGVAGVGCQNWWADTAKETNFQCRYGPYVVDLGLCAIYRKPGTVSPNAPVIRDPQGRPVGIGDPVISTDPDDFKDLDPDPDPDPDHDPLPNPDPDPWQDGDPEPVPQAGQCFPSGWGVFNPVEWVYRPIVCAFTWAWVPPAGSLDTSISRVRDGVGNKPPFDLVESGYVLIGDFMDEANDPACGFENFTPHVGRFNQSGTELRISCAQPPAVQGIYVVAQVIIWLFALYGALRMIRSALGSNDT